MRWGDRRRGGDVSCRLLVSVTTRLVVVFTFYESRAGLIRKIYFEYDRGDDEEGESTTNYEW
jgi:hypothetical protein